MFCAKCGSSNPDSASWCSSCGQPLSGIQTSNSSGVLAADDYAGFWQRFAAVFLDGIVISLVYVPIAFVAGLLWGLLNLGSATALMYIIYPLSFIGSAAYYVLMESGESGATYGKRWVKIKVLDVEGNRVSKGRALARWVAHLLSYITLYIGFLIQPFTAKKQALHDMVAGTVLVKTDKNGSSTTVVVVVIVCFFFMIAFIGILAAIAIPAYQSYTVKAKTVAAVEIGNTAAQAVETYYTRTGKIPASIAETHADIPTYPFISEVLVIPENGEVQVVFNNNLPPAIAGKHISLMPSQIQDGRITWKCSGVDIPPINMPSTCK